MVTPQGKDLKLFVHTGHEVKTGLFFGGGGVVEEKAMAWE